MRARRAPAGGRPGRGRPGRRPRRRGRVAPPSRARHPRRPAAAAGPPLDRPGRARGSSSTRTRSALPRRSMPRCSRPARPSTSCAHCRAASRRRCWSTGVAVRRSASYGGAARRSRRRHRAFGAASDLPPHVETAAYFAVAEALTNVAKHSRRRAGPVRALAGRRRDAGLAVDDDGRGGAQVGTGQDSPASPSGSPGWTARLSATSPVGGPDGCRARPSPSGETGGRGRLGAPPRGPAAAPRGGRPRGRRRGRGRTGVRRRGPRAIAPS